MNSTLTCQVTAFTTAEVRVAQLDMIMGQHQPSVLSKRAMAVRTMYRGYRVVERVVSMKWCIQERFDARRQQNDRK
jgi:hypothetical protein